MAPNIGTWAGPGILLLINGKWHHVLPSALSREAQRILELRATACVGKDHPTIDIQRVTTTPDTSE